MFLPSGARGPVLARDLPPPPARALRDVPHPTQPLTAKLGGFVAEPERANGDGVKHDTESATATVPMVAALYVQTGGAYYGLEGVDPWDEARDARQYAGPWPVVAHPPCNRWSVMGACRGYRDGEDGGCFAAALEAVRTFGGVLEHPRYSLAWSRFTLPRPSRDGWTSALNDPGFTTEVDQHTYGLRFRKPTWLYFVGDEPPAMNWRHAGKDAPSIHNHYGWGNSQRSRTPPAFRDALIAMARGSEALALVSSAAL